MTSPLLVASPGSQWRRHVEATWMYLQKAYEITKNENCATHIHISVKGGYSLQEIKRVAQASIYFEPAFDALVPPHRRVDDRWAQSSWLDSPKLARAGRSRAQSATLIGQVPDIFSLGSLLQPLTKRCYTFSFDSILKYYTIEFRKPPASTSVEEVLGWAELAMNFVQASLKNGYPHLLEKVPPTVGGLRWFLSQSQVATMNEPDRLRCIFGGKHKDAFEQGKFDHVVSKGEVVYRGYVLSEETAEVRSVINRDTARIQRLIQNSTEPYW